MGLSPADLRALASLVRSGLPGRVALEEMARRKETFVEVGKRLRLGASPGMALQGLSGDPKVAMLIRMQEATGADLARALDEEAASRRTMQEEISSARSAASGALLSMKLIAALPFVWLPVGAGRGGVDWLGPDGMCIAVGSLLGCAGWVWMSHLVPSPRPPGVLREVVAGTSRLLDAGSTLDAALRVSLKEHHADPWAGAASRRRELGGSWSHSLSAGGPPGVDAFTDLVERCQREGDRSAEAMRQLVAYIDSEARRGFELRLRRAPVLMVLPLGLCVLPSFLLVAVVPSLRML